MAEETSEKSEYADLAREIVRMQLKMQSEQAQKAQEKETLPAGWNRPFRSWEAIAAFLGVVVLIGTPVLGIRDGVRDVQTSVTTLVKIGADHETRLHAVETKNLELDSLKETRGKRLENVEDAWKHQQDVNAQTQGQIIELKGNVQAILNAQQDSSRKLDDLLSRKH